MTFQKLPLYLSSGKEASNMAGLLDQAISSLGVTLTLNLLRYAPDNRSSQRALTGKQLLKN